MKLPDGKAGRAAKYDHAKKAVPYIPLAMGLRDPNGGVE
jgi:hypothetical protein